MRSILSSSPNPKVVFSRLSPRRISARALYTVVSRQLNHDLFLRIPFRRPLSMTVKATHTRRKCTFVGRHFC